MIVNVTPHDSGTYPAIKEALIRLKRGTRVNSVQFSKGGKGLTASIVRKASIMEVQIYNQNKSIDYSFDGKLLHDGEYLEVRITSKSSRMCNVPKEVLECLTELSINHGSRR